MCIFFADFFVFLSSFGLFISPILVMYIFLHKSMLSLVQNWWSPMSTSRRSVRISVSSNVRYRRSLALPPHHFAAALPPLPPSPPCRPTFMSLYLSVRSCIMVSRHVIGLPKGISMPDLLLLVVLISDLLHQKPHRGLDYNL